eukprot:COSAG01_NODE_1135_length_11553_cov_40.402305_7_plen_429_part_00
MAQKKIAEIDVKRYLSLHWQNYFKDLEYPCLVANQDDLDQVSFAKEKNLIVKPDMLFGGRGKEGLVYLKQKDGKAVDLKAAKAWIAAKQNTQVTLRNGVSGDLTRFIIEPFLEHDAKQEFYISLRAGTDFDTLCVSTQGGVDVEENWDQVKTLELPVLEESEDLATRIQSFIEATFETLDDVATFSRFASAFTQFFRDKHFTFLEINPFVIEGNTIHCLDMVAEVDDSAFFLMDEAWRNMTYYADFGQARKTDAERYITSLDENSGASLKLTLLNTKARVWTLIAGGGASVVYADTIAGIWGADQIANYGEYSGNPSREETYLYTKTLLELMTQEKHESALPKVLLIGGAIANFTDVAKTFEGIIQALSDFAEDLKKVGVKIYVRRAGPNYELALKNIRQSAKKLGLAMEVYGPETHMTDIVKMAHQD